MTVPSISTNALGYGAFLGIYANLRYQLLCGFERTMSSHFDVIGVALFFGTAMRYLSVFSHSSLSYIFTGLRWKFGFCIAKLSLRIYIYTHELEGFA